MWKPADRETEKLRATPDVPPDCSVFRNGDLQAIVYCNQGHWQLYVSGDRRMPEMDEVLDARLTLLKNIEDFIIMVAPEIRNCVLVSEATRMWGYHPPRERLS
jgi:hypothetical protein